MNNHDDDKAFFDIVGDMRNREYNPGLEIFQDYTPVTTQAAHLQDVVETVLAEQGPLAAHTPAERGAVLQKAKLRLDQALREPDQLRKNDVIIARGTMSVLYTDDIITDVPVRELFTPSMRLHGVIIDIDVLLAPEPIPSGVVLDLALPGIELLPEASRNGKASFHELTQYDHVLLPLVFAKHAMELKRLAASQ